MVLCNLCLLALFVALVSTSLDCTFEDTCFGEPKECDPETTCKTLFRFDQQGNLDLYLRNFTDSFGYAAFSVQKHVDDTYEYFICVPHGGQRLRAIAELGEAILVTEQNLTGVVESLGTHNFRCHFDAIELPEMFQDNQEFFVSIGIFDEALVIVDGVQLYNLESEYEDDDALDQDSILQSAHFIGGTVDPTLLQNEDLFSKNDEETLTDKVQEMRSLLEMGDEDVEMEKLARKKFLNRLQKSSRSSIQDDDSERDDDDDLIVPRHRDQKSSNKHHKKSNSRFQDFVDADDSEDIENYLDVHIPNKKNAKKNKDAKHRQKSKYDYDDDDEDEDSEFANDNTSRRYAKDSKKRQSADSRYRSTEDHEDEEDSEVEDDYTPRRFDKKKKNRATRYEDDDVQRKKSKTRRMESEEEYTDNDKEPKRSSTKKNKQNKTTKVEKTDDEDVNSDDDDEYNYDDDENSSGYNINYIAISIILYKMF